MGYLVKFGLYPYFERLLTNLMNKSSWITISFDESFNRTTQTCQMDVQIRFWDHDQKKVVTRYFTSEFLGHTGMSDLLPKIKGIISQLNGPTVIQIGMDGPTTNVALLRVLEAERFAEDLNGFIDIGTCSLHIVHGGLGTGITQSGWLLKDALKSANYMFRDSPAKRQDFFQITKLKDLPMPFAGHRWVEDAPVAQRLISIWPGYKKVILNYERMPPSKRPKCKSYTKAVTSVHDDLCIARLKFFTFICEILKPYLTSHQTDDPMRWCHLCTRTSGLYV